MHLLSIIRNEPPRSELRGITELNFEDFSEAEANPRSLLRGMFKFNTSKYWDTPCNSENAL
jgi:hypothetical protein